MTVRWIAGLVTGLAFVVGLAWHMLALAVAGLVGLLGTVMARPGTNPLAEVYRDVREPLLSEAQPTDPRRDF